MSGTWVVRVAQQWFKWHGIGGFAVLWKYCQWTLSQWQRIGLSGTPVAHWHEIDRACLETNLSDTALDCFRLDRAWESGWNRSLWLVESSECWLLIGPEDLLKMFKEGTLTILNLCHSNSFEALYYENLCPSNYAILKYLEWLQWHSSGSSGSTLGNS